MIIVKSSSYKDHTSYISNGSKRWQADGILILLIFKLVAGKKYLHSTTSDLLAFNMALRLCQIQSGMCKYFLPATSY